MAALDDLLDAVFGNMRPAHEGAPEGALHEEFAGWARDSRRFREFAAEHSTKIRAKLRRAGDDEALADVRAELETALLLLGDRRFALEYEKYAASRQRGPDFTVTFRTHTPFNVEVRRLRSLELDGDYSGKLMAVLVDKVGQTQPGMPNLLWLIAGAPVTADGLDGAATALRALAERKDEATFTRRGYRSAADFIRRYQQLSAIVLHRPGDPAAGTLWLNPIARHKTPPDVIKALQAL